MAQRIVASLLVSLLCLPAFAAGNLENPQPGGRESGIGLVSGWFCNANRIDIEVDGATTYRAAYGTARADTTVVCGNGNSGFALLINWNTLGSGPHQIRALADGVEFARAQANVVTLGAEFQQGKAGTMRLDNFPDAGKGVIVEWQESKQNFVIRDYLQSVPAMNGSWYGPVLEQWYGCNDPQYNGNHGANAIWSVALYDNVNLSINGNIQTSPAFSCSYSGVHAMSGADHAASGTFTCTNGKKGNWHTTEFTVTERGLSLIGEGNWTQGSISCQTKFLLGGYRHLPL
jgi:hypothetical protein